MTVTRSSRNKALQIHDPPASAASRVKARTRARARAAAQVVQNINNTQENTTNITNGNAVWTANKLQGKFPPLTVHSKSAVDALRGKIYFYGGSLFEDENEIPTADFRVFDIESMEFVDLTTSLTHITPPDPDSDVKPNPRRKRLPRLAQPGMAILEVNGNPFIFLFGGHDVDGESDGPSATLIAVDLTNKQWFYVQFEEITSSPGGRRSSWRSPVPRVDPIVVGAEGRLYIFSGLKGFGEKWVYHRSFSVVEFRLGMRSEWIEVDVPYPANVPTRQIFGKGLAIYEGKMILLLPARAQEKSRIDFRGSNIFYFVPKTNAFIRGTLKSEPPPMDVVWYYVSNLDRALSSPAGPLPYGTPAAVPSVILCTWLPHREGNLSPELWKFTVFPMNTFKRLGVADRLYDLEVNFHRFAMIGARAFLFGQGDWEEKDKGKGKKGKNEKKAKKRRKQAMCDTYTEIPVGELLIKDEPA